MTYTLSADQISQLQALVQNPDDPQHPYAAPYAAVANFMSTGAGVLAPGADAEVALWFTGASQVNAGQGASAAFIRAYTSAEIAERTGVAPDATAIQDASNAIGRAVFDRLFSPANGGVVPDLHTLGDRDLSAALQQAPTLTAAGWSGNLLFIMLGDGSFADQNILHLSAPSSDRYDLLASMKAAVDATVAALGTPATDIADAFGYGVAAALSNGAGIATLFSAASFIASADAQLLSKYGLTSFLESAGYSLTVGTELSAAHLLGGSSNDFIIGGHAANTISWSPGTDILDGGVGGSNTLDLSTAGGPLTVAIGGSQATPDLSAVITSGGSDHTSAFDFSNIIGSPSDDHFSLNGFGGQEISIDGGDGNNVLAINAVTDTTIDLTSPPMGTVDFASGSVVHFKNFHSLSFGGENDTIKLSGVAGGSAIALDGGGGSDTIDLSAAGSGQVIDFNGQHSGTAGFEVRHVPTVIGSNAGDTYYVGSDAVSIQGGTGDDLFYAGAGNLTAQGGDNSALSTDDVASLSVGDTLSYQLEGGKVAIRLAEGSVTGTHAGATDNVFGVERVVGSNNGDAFTLDLSQGPISTIVIGGTGDDTFTVSTPNNAAQASQAAAVLVVSAGHDVFDGTALNDSQDPDTGISNGVDIVVTGSTGGVLSIVQGSGAGGWANWTGISQFDASAFTSGQVGFAWEGPPTVGQDSSTGAETWSGNVEMLIGNETVELGLGGGSVIRNTPYDFNFQSGFGAADYSNGYSQVNSIGVQLADGLNSISSLFATWLYNTYGVHQMPLGGFFDGPPGPVG